MSTAISASLAIPTAIVPKILLWRRSKTRTLLPAARVVPLRINYACDENEYVRRRVLLVLGKQKSPAVEDLVDAAWAANEEHQRMVVLEALYTNGSMRLQEFLVRAANDNRPYLIQCATRIQHRE